MNSYNTGMLPSHIAGQAMTHAIDILTFDNVELLKKKNEKTSFSGIGTLHVLFFPDYNRFILYLNDWAYGLLKRIPAVSSTKKPSGSHFYIFPSYSGSYILKLPKTVRSEAIQNFETILVNNTQFTYKDDSPSLGSLPSNVLSDQQDNVATSSVHRGGESNPETVGKLSGKEKFKRGFKRIASKFQATYTVETRPNPNLTRVMDYTSLKSLSLNSGFICPYERKDVEEALVRAKDIAKVAGYDTHGGPVRPSETGSEAGGGFRTSSNVLGTTTVEQIRSLEETPERKMMARGGVVQQQTPIQRETLTPIQVRELKEDENLPVDELELIREIEKQRIAQLEERKMAEKHKINELYHIEKERELSDRIRRESNDPRIFEVRRQALIEEIKRKDLTIMEIQKTREAERLAYEQRQREVIYKLENDLAELRQKEELTEAEHLQIEAKKSELLQVLEQRQAEAQSLVMRKTELLKLAQQQEAEINERLKMTEDEREEMRREEREVQMEYERRLNELVEKQQLTEAEHVELQNKREEVLRLVGVREAERLQVERYKLEFEEETQMQLADLMKKERFTEEQLAEVEQKRAELRNGAEARLNELVEKEQLTESEHMELARRREELARIIEMTETELLEIPKRRQQMEEDFIRRGQELEQRFRLTEKERIGLEEIRVQLQQKAMMNVEQINELELRRKLIIEECESRAMKIDERARLGEEEHAELLKREQELTLELESRLVQLRQREELTQSEMLEIQERERELVELQELHEVEYRNKTMAIEKLKKAEMEIFAKNKELMEGEWKLTQELMKLDENLQVVPDLGEEEETVVRTKRVVTRDVGGDMSRSGMSRQRTAQNETISAEPTMGLS